MFIGIGMVIVVALLLAVSRFRAPGGEKARHLGSMSEQWRAEQRTRRP
jgi:hypothetical protein